MFQRWSARMRQHLRKRVERNVHHKRVQRSIAETQRYWSQIEGAAELAGIQPYIINRDSGISLVAARHTGTAEDFISWADYEAAPDGIIHDMFVELLKGLPQELLGRPVGAIFTNL